MLTRPLTYAEWNERLAAHFFQPSMASRQVYLYVTNELLAELGAPLGVRDFVNAVKTGPAWVHQQGLAQQAYHTYLRWRSRRLQYPPYIAYLGLFVLAAGLEGDFAPHAYYPRLRKLIGEPPGSTLPSFSLMQFLWNDLARWSGDDKHGELGIFTVRVSGSWLHVGLPIAQAILTEHERRALPTIFAAANLDPTSPPSDSQLTRSIVHHGAYHLRARTIQLLRNASEQSDVRDILVTSIKDELIDWDGSTGPSRRTPPGSPVPGSQPPPNQPTHPPAGRSPDSNPPAGAPSPAQQVHASLRLCISRLDRVAGKVTTGLRCSTRHEFPDSGLKLRGAPSHIELCCEEALQGWSTLLSDCETGTPIDGAQFNWALGLELQDSRLDWRSRLSDSQARIFVSGASEGLPGLIEINQLPRQTRVHIAAAKVVAAEVSQWGQRSCRDFKEIRVQSGLPPRWRLFQCEEVLSDETIKDTCPSLSFSHSVRLSLSGGIRSSRGNRYFYFALPNVSLDGGEGSERLYCNDREMTRLPDSTHFALPEQAAQEDLLVIQTRRGAEIVAQLFVSVTREVEWQKNGTPWLFDKFGMLVTDAGPGVTGLSGSLPVDLPLLPFPFAFPPHILEGKVILIGRVPGQIRVWPDETTEQEWMPIWAVQLRKKRLGRVIFCGEGADNVHPVPQPASIIDRRRLRRWKEVLWYSRKRIAAPVPPELRALWLEYQEAARELQR